MDGENVDGENNVRFANFYNEKVAETQNGGGFLAVWSEAAGGWVALAELLGDESWNFASTKDVLWANAESNFFAEVQKALDEAGADVATLDFANDDYFYLPPVEEPEKILCVGLNYADHVREFGNALPEVPVIFNKAPSALNACDAAIALPKVSNRVDYEGELVVVIGKEGKDIPRSEAMEYVAGYCCGNDVSARDWQKDKPGGQWFLGKSFDSFAPIGPTLVTADEVGDPNALKIETRLNGETVQSGNTSDFIFPIDYLISYISQVMTLNVGDLLFTGTPCGVGDARKPPLYLKAGDEIVVEIEKVGTLRNLVVED